MNSRNDLYITFFSMLKELCEKSPGKYISNRNVKGDIYKNLGLWREKPLRKSERAKYLVGKFDTNREGGSEVSHVKIEPRKREEGGSFIRSFLKNIFLRILARPIQRATSEVKIFSSFIGGSYDQSDSSGGHINLKQTKREVELWNYTFSKIWRCSNAAV